MVDEIRKVVERLAPHAETDVTWLAERDRSRGGNQLCVAPLEVWGPLRHKLLAHKTVVFTSATLKLGGDFTVIATSLGLRPSDRVDHSIAAADELSSLAAVVADEAPNGAEGAQAAGDAPEVLPWRGIDVGSPFDYRAQSILYVAKHLPTPGRDGIGPAQIDEIRSLVEAAGGRTLGLFSSRRAAEVAAEAVRERMPHMPILCQGDGQLSHLQAEFVSNPAVSLFGTLSLWQGLDVPGDTCQLVIIDRIPFPRPDDPLMSARSRAAERAGGNGFMAVSATHAALLLAQGSGRLIRSRADRGVVAVLDPRLATARYGTFLRASLAPMWTTYDGALVRAALQRLNTQVSSPSA
jgi:ATP-dependent DNA helicase DinG